MNKEKRSNTARSSASGTSNATADKLPTVESRVEKELAQGFRGTEVDPTPNENYTVAGVTSGAPTPETDVDSAKDVRSATGLGLSALEAADREKTERGEK
jgi:hypothetical protein